MMKFEGEILKRMVEERARRPSTPTKAQLWAAVVSYAAYTRGTESTRTKEDREWAERLESDAWEKVRILIDALPIPDGPEADGEREGHFMDKPEGFYP